jgi:hypothetical protein
MSFNNQSNLNNPSNQHSTVTGFSNDKQYGMTPGNIGYAGPSTSAQALAGKGLMKITSGMSGGGRSRRHRHRHSRGSKKYARKRSLRHRIKHRKSGKRKHGHRHTKRRGQRGGYHQYLSNQAFTLGQRLPGFPLLPSQSALANPPPFMPYRNCPGGM